jgi:TonB family protein
MTAALSSTSPLRRWTVLASGAAVGLQFALVFWLGDKAPVTPRRAAHEPRLLLAPAWAGDLSELDNPTLFAWSGPHGFSGQAAGRPTPGYQPFQWTEPPRFLELDPKQLSGQPAGEPPSRLTVRLDLLPGRGATMVLPTHALAGSTLPTRSTVRLEGELADRPLLTPMAPPPQSLNDVLPDTRVRAVVDAPGRVQSVTLLGACGVAEADAQALELTRAARFAPLAPGTASALQTGVLVFQWHTQPLAPTNAPPP